MARRGGFQGGMPGNMNNLMKQAQKMQRQMEEQQKEMEEKEFEMVLKHFDLFVMGCGFVFFSELLLHVVSLLRPMTIFHIL